MSSTQENACSDCVTLREENQRLRQKLEFNAEELPHNHVGEVSKDHERRRFIANKTKDFRAVIPFDENFLPDYGKGGCIGEPVKRKRVDRANWEAWIWNFWEACDPDILDALVHDEGYTPKNPQLFPPDPQMQSLWADRCARAGFSNEIFPPISLSGQKDELLAAMLQLLFIASPDDLMALANQEGPAWELSPTHPAVILCDDYFRGKKSQLKARHRWIPITQNGRFRGTYGTLINRLDVFCNAPTWQKFFDQSFGPVDIPPFGFGSNVNTQSIQTFVADNTTPTYLTINVKKGSDLYAFPDGGFSVPMRCPDGSGVFFRVRWVGGVYRTKIGTRVIFDWGDGSTALGMSITGDWNTQSPLRFSREELAQLVEPRSNFQALFRRF
ncbi:hypothetical protein IWX90DRAFT_515637 [Phyllosticta citrichinensis]|uniref:Uncharacterized protein n=1 Tax=Phyllosticta citrichinensis TaxID=1130410 RepID=A0ABR1XP62_9PEZI